MNELKRLLKNETKRFVVICVMNIEKHLCLTFHVKYFY
ncbi:MAG: hypothetical protein PWP68_1571 [Rikenellaceae bacterium]|jgi:hypothetical protein|nr:hypothetical protein [Rikenellaceae bacterium]MDI3546154.1 hypothetical protein [Rikenellaceae bacterium]